MLDALRMAELPEALLDLAVPHEDVNELLALRPALLRDPALVRTLEGAVRELVRDVGEVSEKGSGPELGEWPEPFGRCLPVFLYAAALPYARAYHQERDIPDGISRRTLADLGRNMAVHRRKHGTGGLIAADWPRLHFRGELYQLGRLQFQRARLGGRMGRAVADAGTGLGPGDPCLELHIPDFSGPLSPAECGRSLELAREFFARYFPEETYRVAVCSSWLLDPQLRTYLPEGSNILSFQDRFRSGYPQGEPADTEPVHFVFGDRDLAPAELSRRTAVERAIADHLLAGRHWYGGNGWFEW
ncbi:acyltransferase domain-containing protein [Streptomyces sp. NPDC050504]|uniref:acyltransferase domain-containing protein n=1 Tax=Streptomyces sp. NPDC050504 TaxID=3365618 RepID=UPI0037B36D3B